MSNHRELLIIVASLSKRVYHVESAIPRYTQAGDGFLLSLGFFPSPSLLERDEPRRVGRTDTRPSVSDGLVADGELTEVVSNHFRFDLDRGE